MILEIESAYGDMLIHGKDIEYSQLQTIVKELLTLVGERAFASSFCIHCGYEPIPYDDNTKIDYTIDLDTHMIIRPKY